MVHFVGWRVLKLNSEFCLLIFSYFVDLINNVIIPFIEIKSKDLL